MNQRLRFFLTKSRAEILPRCKRDYLLPRPINRGSVDDLKKEKIGSKNHKKPSFPLFPFSFFPRQPSIAFSTSATTAFSDENTNKPNLYTTPNNNSTIGSQQATNRPLTSHCDSLLSSPSSLSLSSATFSSSSHSQLWPPSPQSMPPEPPTKHPHHIHNPHAGQLSPPCSPPLLRPLPKFNSPYSG